MLNLLKEAASQFSIQYSFEKNAVAFITFYSVSDVAFIYMVAFISKSHLAKIITINLICKYFVKQNNFQCLALFFPEMDSSLSTWMVKITKLYRIFSHIP